jgi:hypothetical protein
MRHAPDLEIKKRDSGLSGNVLGELCIRYDGFLHQATQQCLALQTHCIPGIKRSLIIQADIYGQNLVVCLIGKQIQEVKLCPSFLEWQLGTASESPSLPPRSLFTRSKLASHYLRSSQHLQRYQIPWLMRSSINDHEERNSRTPRDFPGPGKSRSKYSTNTGCP